MLSFLFLFYSFTFSCQACAGYLIFRARFLFHGYVCLVFWIHKKAKSAIAYAALAPMGHNVSARMLTSLISLIVSASVVCASGTSIQSSSYVVPGAFPTTAYASYWNSPTATSAQVQPVISDPVSHQIYPLELTNPDNIPQNDTADPHPLPPVQSSSTILQAAITQIQTIANSSVFGNNTCAQCLAGMEIAKFVAMAAPSEGPALAVALCEYFDYSSDCAKTYGSFDFGTVLTQVISYADAGGLDGQSLCYEFLSLCPYPAASPLDLDTWFAKPKPNPLPAPKTPSGQKLKILHLSDIHLDPRYATGSEANCSDYQCCRTNVYNVASPDTPLLPAPRFGAYYCDTPLALAIAAMEAIPELTGTKETGFNFTLYTGDLTSHDPEYQLSEAYVEYAETILYDMIKQWVSGSSPVYATLGNHDSYNEAQAASLSMPGELAQQFSWNYNHVAGLWQHEKWLPESAIEYSRTHYGGYAVSRADGLKIISLDTNLWYASNYFNYINMSSSDPSGILRFLTDELQDSEDAGERVWIIGHVLSGWDGTQGLGNPTNLFYQIVDRFSPHVIANIFWGHTHEDQLSIFYANNATNISTENALNVAWIGPSVTPLTNLNSGFRVYEVDSATFDIIDSYTWKSDVNSFPELESQTEYGPTYSFEYSAREAYGGSIPWGASDPLNATWWHLVTEAMEKNNTLVSLFNTYQGKSSVMSPNCTSSACVEAKICFIRSGSSTLSMQNCPRDYTSVQ